MGFLYAQLRQSLKLQKPWQAKWHGVFVSAIDLMCMFPMACRAWQCAPNAMLAAVHVVAVRARIVHVLPTAPVLVMCKAGPMT